MTKITINENFYNNFAKIRKRFTLNKEYEPYFWYTRRNELSCAVIDDTGSEWHLHGGFEYTVLPTE